MNLRLGADTVGTEAEDGMVLLNQRTGAYWQLNQMGAHTLERLLAGRTESEVADEFAAVYGVDPARVRDDITAMTERLREAGLVERGSGR
ncbi:lasso peptide biosynthesis PqqD family chaperone [Saccharothrix obliqua]|uniref:lasso peptide biosynthesis PqqD family chaperone n=1 Tax=Saccharothrix obliqua TaxID=2861747 RepID=UPI001C5FAB5C|nr:lasso peptide biosynthesis PqqD family chaperone [Saccharothrix obliqua]MBW4718143.1 lasso peptide biosynthesis PqqD family chaperone [Saccharothrix obliqua]